MDWVGGWNAKTGKRFEKIQDLEMDVRVFRSKPTNENWECRASCASQEENKTVPFI